ncbi:accessory gene regulator ArgB-like protein [Ruminococcus flavefaciens]|uniref:Accessory gene regulator B n=1 Tax=Ruminococcus flavefaciens 007c TaxID=1341157 RepID=W7UXN6_RUMFL|nr:accessory gene regulator B family protein [Ruminococcus flavefaciens]EWM53132.1 hypothetical protein RF007C_16095 [Ruminococcus flavefaciens 007c]
MISKLSKKTAVFFSKYNIISSEDIDAYAYGFELLISTAVNFAAAIFIAIITGEFLSSALCLAAFLSLRVNAGGYHAETHIGCVAILVTILLLFTAAVKFLPDRIKALSVPFILIFSAAVIILFAPVQHPNHPLSENSSKRLRKKSLYLLVAWNIFCIAFYFFMPEISFFAASGTLISAGALISEKLRIRHNKNK